ncbi:MAG: hypothetical protein IJU86_03830 [Firmicutes bacterium]|nr:hypothetical protein [Bacillota bacterium]
MAKGLKKENKYQIVQVVLLLAALTLFPLMYFTVWPLIYFSAFISGILLDIELGFMSMFLITLFLSIFVERKGVYEQLKDADADVEKKSLAIFWVLGLLIIGFAALGYIASGVVLSFGIQLFLIGMFNLLRFLNENLLRSENNFLKLFYKTENTTLAISILTCLSLSVMVLCGYCDLAFAISFGTPLLGVSLILKLGMFLYDRYKKGKQQTEIVLTDNSNENKNPNSNLGLNNNKDNQKDNHFPPQGDDNKENKETELKNQKEQTLGENK